MNKLTKSERVQRAKDLGIIVDEQDLWLLEELTWRLSTKGYVESTLYHIDGRMTVKLHHFIIGRPLNDLQVDHKDNNKLNNSRNNLQIVSTRDNSLNRDFIRTAKNWKLSKNGRYEARITEFGNYIHLGTFGTQQEAENAVESYKLRHDAIIKTSEGDNKGSTYI